MAVCPIDAGRYGSEEMKKIFNEETRLQKMLDVEVAATYAHAQVGNIPKKAAEQIANKATTKYVKVERVKEIEAQIGHDVMAVVKALTEVCEEEGSKWVHYGLTSNDVLDTATGLQVKEAAQIIKRDLVSLEKVLIKKCVQYRDLPIAGRTHGQQAGIVTLGLKLAVWLREVARHLERFLEAEKRFAVGKIMGVVGTGAGLGDHALEIQDLALKKLGLSPADMVNQIIQRDIYAELVAIIANVANTLDKIGTEIRNLQRTEINELMEPFRAKTQVGSSAMPAKRNPVKSENVCSLARLIRGLVFTEFENVPLWHERDLTNSANERFTIPFSFILIDDMLRSIAKILDGLVVFEENIQRNLELTSGLILAEKVSIELVKKGLGRQEAHEEVRVSSMEAYQEKKSFKESLITNPMIASRLTEKEIETLLDYSKYLGVSGRLVDEAVKKTENEIDALSRHLHG